MLCTKIKCVQKAMLCMKNKTKMICVYEIVTEIHKNMNLCD